MLTARTWTTMCDTTTTSSNSRERKVLGMKGAGVGEAPQAGFIIRNYLGNNYYCVLCAHFALLWSASGGGESGKGEEGRGGCLRGGCCNSTYGMQHARPAHLGLSPSWLNEAFLCSWWILNCCHHLYLLCFLFLCHVPCSLPSPHLLVTVVVVSVRQILGQTFDAQSAFVGGISSLLLLHCENAWDVSMFGTCVRQ